MAVFDPFVHLERWIPGPWIHRLIRAGGVAVFGLFLLLRIGGYPRFLLKPLWAAETAVYAALILAYLLRGTPRDRSRGAREILVPLAGALLPFALLAAPPSPALAGDRSLLLAVFWWMAAGTTLTAWGIFSLRRSFSITVETRELVTAGPYRILRHPVYLGEILSTAAVAFWRRSVLNAFLFVLFAALQLWRSRMEEEKLARNFPEDFPAWAERSWWFWKG